MPKYRARISYPVTVWRDYETTVEADCVTDAEEMAIADFRMNAPLDAISIPKDMLVCSAGKDSY